MAFWERSSFDCWNFKDTGHGPRTKILKEKLESDFTVPIHPPILTLQGTLTSPLVDISYFLFLLQPHARGERVVSALGLRCGLFGQVLLVPGNGAGTSVGPTVALKNVCHGLRTSIFFSG
jgi:hypothetical protein